MRARRGGAAVAMATAVLLVGCAGGSAPSASEFPDALAGATLQARVADAVTSVGVSDGDLWPTC